MAETYANKTLAVTATHNAAQSTGSTKTVTLPDSHTAQGNRLAAMRSGQQIICQLPDGQTGRFIYDAALSTPNNPVLLRVS